MNCYLFSAPHSQQPKSQSLSTGKERRSIKIFISMTLLFLISFIPYIFGLTGFFKSPFVLYLYFINHFGNSLIYFIIDSNFRNEANRVLKKDNMLASLTTFYYTIYISYTSFNYVFNMCR